MYKVIERFMDLQDEKHIYEIGDTYPRKGSKPSKERIEELASDKNLIGFPLIRSVEPKPKAEKPKATKKSKGEGNGNIKD